MRSKKTKTIGTKDISVDIAGVKFRTPVGVGSVGGLPMRREYLTTDLYVGIFLKHIAAGAGFICLPHTIHVPDALLSDLQKRAKPLIPPNASRRPLIFLRAGQKNSIYSLAPSGNTPAISAGIFRNSTSILIEKLRKQKPQDIPLIANVSGLGFFPETFVAGAKAHEEAGVDLIELNFSSPATVQATLDEGVQSYFEKDFPLVPPGLFLGDQPDLVEKVTQDVSRAVSIPVGVKISAETGFPRVIELARRIRDAGGRFITCSNFSLTVVPPDIYNRGKSMWPNLKDSGPMATISGDWLRPLVYKQIASVARFAPGIQIIGCGGISKPEHVVEAMMLGATAVQMVTPMLMQGRKLITRDVRFLEKYMEKQAYTRTEDFRGLALGYIKAAKTLHSVYDEHRILVKVDTEKCKGCGICSDSICLAISVEGAKARVNTEMCAGCGMCVAVCPHEAIRLE